MDAIPNINIQGKNPADGASADEAKKCNDRQGSREPHNIPAVQSGFCLIVIVGLIIISSYELLTIKSLTDYREKSRKILRNNEKTLNFWMENPVSSGYIGV